MSDVSINLTSGLEFKTLADIEAEVTLAPKANMLAVTPYPDIYIFLPGKILCRNTTTESSFGNI